MWNKSTTAGMGLFACALLLVSCYQDQLRPRANPRDPLSSSWHGPEVQRVPDTTVSIGDTVTVEVRAVDRNGSVTTYYWDTDGYGWHDTTDAPRMSFSRSTGGTITVVWGAVDNAGLIGIDTFSIRFNTPPVSATLTAPGTYDSDSWQDFAGGKGGLPLTLSAADPDGTSDTLTYILLMSKNGAPWDTAYAGGDDQCVVPAIEPSSTCEWQLVVKDIYGDSVTDTGSFVAPVAPPPAGMRLLNVKGTSFTMGSNSTEGTNIATAYADERPAHQVRFTCDFWIDTTEVSQEEYAELLGVSPWFNVRYVGQETEGPRYPAWNFTWYDALVYCNARSKRDALDTVYSYTSRSGTPGKDCLLQGVEIHMERNGYRLPTEAEWEYACRAGTSTEYYWGESAQFETATRYAWYYMNAQGYTYSTPEVDKLGIQPVGTKVPNAFGLYNMAGNAQEWCQDWYSDTYYAIAASVTDPAGPNTGSYRVVRGAAMKNDRTFALGCARRGRCDPADVRYEIIGMRCVRSVP